MRVILLGLLSILLVCCKDKPSDSTSSYDANDSEVENAWPIPIPKLKSKSAYVLLCEVKEAPKMPESGGDDLYKREHYHYLETVYTDGSNVIAHKKGEYIVSTDHVAPVVYDKVLLFYIVDESDPSTTRQYLDVYVNDNIVTSYNMSLGDFSRELNK